MHKMVYMWAANVCWAVRNICNCSWDMCFSTSITKQHALYIMWMKMIQYQILHTWISGKTTQGTSLFCWILLSLKNTFMCLRKCLSSQHFSFFCAVSLADCNLVLASLADRDVISFSSLRLNFSSDLLINILTFPSVRLFFPPLFFFFHIQLFCRMHAHTYRPR